MSADAGHTSYTLAPDVRVERDAGGAFLRTPISETWIEAGVDLQIVALLDGTTRSEDDLHVQLRRTDTDADTRCAALLYRLDRLGFLTRTLSSGERRLASCVPLRPASDAPPDRPPEGLLRLSAHALARVDGDLIALEKPGAWARLRIHDRDLQPLLHDLAAGRP